MYTLLITFLSCSCVLFIVRESSWNIKQNMLIASFILSTIHAIIVGLYGLIELPYQDSCLSAPSFSKDYTILELTMGYLISDLIFVAWHQSPKSIIFHHIFSTFGLGLGRYFGLGYGLGMTFLRTEISTIPLNICWFMKKANKDKGISMWIMGAILLLSYFLFRILAIKWVVYDCVSELYSFLPWYLSLPGIFVILFNSVANCKWYIQIINKLLFREPEVKIKNI
jgi:hypothetical protein